MAPETLRNLFRAEVRDEALPYLWSDPEVYNYMSEAQATFVRRVGGIPDAAMQASAPAGGGYFALPLFLLKLKSAVVEVGGRRRDLGVLNYEDLQYRPEFSSWPNTPPGAPTHIVIGDLDGHASLYPSNTEDAELTLIGYRLPLESITGPSSVLEIREEHHYSLLMWMKHLAHLKQDAETYDRGRATQFAADFMRYCDDAKAEQERRAHKPRTILYGGL